MIVKRERFNEYNRRQLHDRIDLRLKQQFFPSNPLQSAVEKKQDDMKLGIQSAQPSKEQQVEFSAQKSQSVESGEQEKDALIIRLKEMIKKLQDAMNSQ